MTAVQGVLFDVDDTLVDHGGAQSRAIRGHLSELGLPYDDAAVERWRLAEERHFRRHLSGELTFQGQRRARVREVLDAPDLDDVAADEWFAGFLERFEAGWERFDDVVELLDQLADRELHVGIVTNVGSQLQRRKLAAVGLGDRFPVLVGLDALGVGKPDPRIFHHACALLGTEPVETAFVGDRLDDDAVGARDAGLRAVWLDRVGSAAEVPEGVTRVTSLGGVLAVLT